MIGGRVYGNNIVGGLHSICANGDTACGKKFANQTAKSCIVNSWHIARYTCRHCREESPELKRVAVGRPKWGFKHILCDLEQKTLCGKCIISNRTVLTITPIDRTKNLCPDCAAKMVQNKLLE